LNAHLGARPWLAHARHDYAVMLMSRSQPGDQEHTIALPNEATAQRWARAQGMPRYAFVKAPVEIKPFYVDFDSPIYVEILAKTVRRTGEANLAEPLITVT
jgi:hypothetical protein